jgi:hypothetical protein
MTRTALLRSWLVAPPLQGRWLALWIIVALPVAALIDRTMGCPDAIGECCTPFFLFILITAVLFGWRAAVVGAVASAAAAYWLDTRPPNAMHMGGEVGVAFGAGLFFAYCAVIIIVVELTRRTMARFARLHNPNEYSSGVIFSLEKGQAWASWPGEPMPVRLGPQQEVAAMMEDFLAQLELARRLGSNGTARGEASPVPLG